MALIDAQGRWILGDAARSYRVPVGVDARGAPTSTSLFGGSEGARIDAVVREVIAERGVRVVEVDVGVSGETVVEVALAPTADARVVAWVRDISARRAARRRTSALMRAQDIARRLSASLVEPVAREADAAIDRALAGIGEMAAAERAYVFLARDGQQADLLDNTHEWCAPEVAPQRHLLQGLPAEDFGFFVEPLRLGVPLYIPSVPDLPDEAAAERELLGIQGIDCLLAVPVAVDGELIGFLGVDNPSFEPMNHDEFAGLMQILADAIASRLRRVDAMAGLVRLTQQLKERAAWQQRLAALALALARAASVDALAQIVVFEGAPLLKVTTGELAAPTPGAALVRRWTTTEDGGPARVSQEFAMCEVCTRVIAVGGPVASSGAHAVSDLDWSRWVDPAELAQVAAFPLDGGHAPLGALTLVRSGGCPWSDETMSRATQFAALVAAHLAAVLAREELYALTQSLEARVDARTRELRTSEQRFRQVFEHAPYAMLRVDADGNILSANRFASRLFDRTQSELSADGLRGLLPVAAYGELAAAVATSLAGGAEDREAFSGSGLRGDGSLFDAEWRVAALAERDETRGIVGVLDVSHRRRSEGALERALIEKEALSLEVLRRVRDDLQTVSSLLVLASDHVPTPRGRQVVHDVVQRVRTIRFVHEQMAQTGARESIDFGLFAHRIVDGLRRSSRTQARVVVQAEPVSLSVDAAMSLGLILTELVSNAIRYGAGLHRSVGISPTSASKRTIVPEVVAESVPLNPRSAWDILVELGGVSQDVWLSVTDSGPGLPPHFSLDGCTTIGLQLVRTLARQLPATVQTSNVPGARFRVHYRQVHLERPIVASSPFELLLVEGGVIVQSIPLGDLRVVVGRAVGSALVAAEPTVSTRHAAVWREGDRVWIEDLGSRNCTYVNGSPIATAVCVGPTDRIELGHRAGLRIHCPDRGTGPPIGFVVESMDTGERHSATTDRVRMGGSVADDIVVRGASPGEVTLLLSPCGAINLGRAPASERPLRFGEPFEVGPCEYRVLGMPPSAATTVWVEPVTYPYCMKIFEGSADTARVVLVHRELGLMEAFTGRANALLLVVLGRQWRDDRAARKAFPQRGWVTITKLTEQLGDLLDPSSGRTVRDLVAEVRGSVRRAGFDPWFIEMRGQAVRVRVREVSQPS